MLLLSLPDESEFFHRSTSNTRKLENSDKNTLIKEYLLYHVFSSRYEVEARKYWEVGIVIFLTRKYCEIDIVILFFV